MMNQTFRGTGVPCSVLTSLLLVHVAGFAHANVWPESFSPLFPVDTAIHIEDTDNDGMPDSWELANGLNINVNDSAGNPDGDTFTNIEEFNVGLNPLVAEPFGLPQSASADFILAMTSLSIDTDGDGMPDAWEIANAVNTVSNDAASDADGDGLTNLEEFNGGWNPQVAEIADLSQSASGTVTFDTGASQYGFGTDTDGDGMPDWWELKYGLNRLVQDHDGDLDGDGLSNLSEYLLGMNPSRDGLWGMVATVSLDFLLDTIGISPDTDGDGMRDWWEIVHGLNISSNDAALDPDMDGRSNLDEYNANTDPNVDDWHGPSRVESLGFTADTGGFNGGYADDTDGDGMPDWWEQKYALNWLVNDASGNPDNDALSNFEEYNAGTNPQAFDFLLIDAGEGNLFVLDTGGQYFDLDGDGMPNWWERIYSGNITSFAASIDGDMDWHSNLEEYIANTDPTDPDSVFKVLEVSSGADGGGWMLTWESKPGRMYRIYSTTDLQASWPANPVYQVTGDGTPKNYTNRVVSGAIRFYLIDVELINPP